MTTHHQQGSFDALQVFLLCCQLQIAAAIDETMPCRWKYFFASHSTHFLRTTQCVLNKTTLTQCEQAMLITKQWQNIQQQPQQGSIMKNQEWQRPPAILAHTVKWAHNLPNFPIIFNNLTNLRAPCNFQGCLPRVGKPHNTQNNRSCDQLQGCAKVRLAHTGKHCVATYFRVPADNAHDYKLDRCSH